MVTWAGVCLSDGQFGRGSGIPAEGLGDSPSRIALSLLRIVDSTRHLRVWNLVYLFPFFA